MEDNVKIKTQIIKLDYEFKRAYKKGSSFVNPVIVIYIIKNKKKINRIGITTSRKIGNAVIRNRCRRIIRESFFQIEDLIKPGYDIVFVARGKTSFLKTQDVNKAMKAIFTKAKLFIDCNESKNSDNAVS